MVARAPVTDQHLENLLNEGLSTADIARRPEVPLSQSAVHARLHRSGALQRRRIRREALARTFAELYESGMSVQQIVDMDGVELGWDAVRRLILSTGTRIRPTWINSGVAGPHPQRPDISTEQLQHMYEAEGRSLREIAEMVGIGYTAVHCRLSTAGVRFRRTGNPGYRIQREQPDLAAA